MALLGPRQVGKTTLAMAVARRHPGALVLDMEHASDRAAVANPELLFSAYRDRLFVLERVQYMPQLFAALRPEIDADRRPGRFLLLGSASAEVLRRTGESLAGRIAYIELSPVLVEEVVRGAQVHGAAGAAAALSVVQSLWLRGG